MKIAKALERKESPLLPLLRKLLKDCPADSIYDCQELAKHLGCTRRNTKALLSESEFDGNKIRDGRRFLYGSTESIAAFEKAKRTFLR